MTQAASTWLDGQITRLELAAARHLERGDGRATSNIVGALESVIAGMRARLAPGSFDAGARTFSEREAQHIERLRYNLSTWATSTTGIWADARRHYLAELERYGVPFEQAAAPRIAIRTPEPVEPFLPMPAPFTAGEQLGLFA